MPTEPVDDHDRRETGLEACMAELTAEIDRLWEDQHDKGDLSAGGDGSGDGDREAESETSAAVIDAVVEPPSGASQSAVDEAVAAAESGDDRTRETDWTDELSM